MPCEIDRRIGLFKIKEIWCAERPYDIPSVDYVIFYQAKNKSLGFNCNELNTVYLDLSPDLDTLFNNIDVRFRKDLRRAIRHGIKVKIDHDYDDFLRLAKEFHDIKGLPKSLIPTVDFMKKTGKLFVAYIDDKMLAGQFYMECHPTFLYHTAVRKITKIPSENQLVGMAVRLLVWEAIKYAKEHGFMELDFGGTSPDLSSTIDRFKLKFGSKPRIEYNCKKVYNPLIRAYLFIRSFI